MRNTFFLLAISCTLFTYSQKRNIELTDIWASGTFYPKTISGFVSMKEGKSYSIQETNAEGFSVINEYDYVAGTKLKEVINAKDVFRGQKVSFDDYHFNDDQSIVLLYYNSQAIYRHSTVGDFRVFDLKGNIETGKGEQVRYPTLSPKGDKVAYVKDNDLYILDLIKGKTKRITKDGSYNSIINGAVDWVYEEEFGFVRAFDWSPDSSEIVYMRFDESKVPIFSMDIYGKDVYQFPYRFRYPKAGEENASISLHIYDLQNQQTIPVAIGNDSTQYIPRIKWTNQPNTLCVLRLNRHQDNLDYLLVNANTGKSTVILNEKSSTYIDINDDLYFLKISNQFIISSEKNGFNHLYLYDLKGKLINQITKGNWDLTSFYGLNEKENTLYFQAAAVNAMQREIYSIGINGKGMKQLSKSVGTNNATFSSNCAYYINFYSNANTPNFISLHDQTGLQMRVLETNEKLNNKLNEFALSKKEFLTIPTENNTLLNAWMIKPVDFDAKKKYPVFMFLYGGPGSQQVTDAWGSANYLWYQMLAAKGYIVVCVDNRGTGARGAAFKKCTFLQLGKLEIADQINAAKWLGAQSYVDASRIGIQGWSFGGYMSALAITKGADFFKMAIAVAPVTNWKYYDSIYTERYLHTPKENSAGFEENSPINYVDKIKGKFLIIHGTADDNVHFQNAADMVSAMIKANKKFESAYYPNKNHSIAGGNTRLHLYNLMTDFILTNL